MKAMILIALTSLFLCACATKSPVSSAISPSGLENKVKQFDSRYDFGQTVSALKQAFAEKGMTVFAEIDHKAAAQSVGLEMQPATVIVFGTPKAGTPLMVKDPSFALQLPLKVLVTEVSGKTKVVVNDTQALISSSQISYDEVKNTLKNTEILIEKTVR